MRELVSVVIPVFGRGDTLARAIRSALRQRDVDVEVIVVDDASPRPVAPVISNLVDEVLVLRQAHNTGPGSARNRGVEAARGDILAFLDADDAWREDKLAAQLPLSTPGNAVVSDYVMVDHVATRRRLVRIAPRSLRDPAFSYMLNPSTLLVRRADFLRAGRFPPCVNCAEDWVLFTRLLRTGTNIARVAEPLVEYHWSTDSTTASHAVRIAHTLGALDFLSHDDWPSSELRRLRGITYGRVAQMAANAGDVKSGVRFATRALASASAPGAIEAARMPLAFGRGVARRLLRGAT
jgi:glycosyltransferase involved in cell wall biosynthesis